MKRRQVARSLARRSRLAQAYLGTVKGIASDTETWCEPYVPVSTIAERGTVAPASYTDTPLARYERAALPRGKVTVWPNGKPNDFYGDSMRKTAREAGL